MKTLQILFLALMVGIYVSPEVQADTYNTGWTCYSSNNYKGSKKTLQAGEYDNCSNWNYYSWKSNCCVKLYFYYKDGKKGEKILCGDVKDLRYEMKKWGNLKYGYQGGWKNISKAVFYCEGDYDQTAQNDKHNNNNNNYGDYKDILSKGHCVVWKERNYSQSFVGYAPGKKYYPKDIKYHFWSLQCPDNYEVYWVYRSKNGKDEEYTCSGKIFDLRTHFNKWNVQNKNNAWNYVKYFEIRKKGNDDNNYGKADAYKYKDWYNKYKSGGYIVFTKYQYFDGQYAAKAPGDYNNKKLGFYPQSVFIPNYSIYLVLEYRDRNNRIKSLTIKESVEDLGKYLYKYGVHRDYEKYPYQAITRLAVIRQ
jgi:hypothetical protein